MIWWDDIPKNVVENICYKCGLGDIRVPAMKYVERLVEEINKSHGVWEFGDDCIYFENEACYNWFLLRWS